jgi:oligopeptide transport system permease protein
MLTEALLSFLGLGVQAPLASWGTLVTEGSTQIVVYPWLLVFPAIAMGAAILALNFIGDGIRDALDPQRAAFGMTSSRIAVAHRAVDQAGRR